MKDWMTPAQTEILYGIPQDRARELWGERIEGHAVEEHLAASAAAAERLTEKEDHHA